MLRQWKSHAASFGSTIIDQPYAAEAGPRIEPAYVQTVGTRFSMIMHLCFNSANISHVDESRKSPCSNSTRRRMISIDAVYVSSIS